MSIPPLLSSTPPPLDESQLAADNDDDFGDFHDFASVSAVSSSMSIPDGSCMFQPIETAEPSFGGLKSVYSVVKSDNLQEDGEWSEFDNAVMQTSAETIHTVDSNDCTGNRLLANGSECDSNCHEDSAVSDLCEENTAGPVTISPSTSRVSVSEPQNSDAVHDCYDGHSNEGLECNAENSCCEVHPISADCEKLDNSHLDLHQGSDAIFEDRNLELSGECIEQYGDEDASVSGDETYDIATDENNAENPDSFHVPLQVTESDTASRSASDENDFANDFQSYSSCAEITEPTALEGMQSHDSNVGTEAFIDPEEQEASCSVEPSEVATEVLAGSREPSLSEVDPVLSSVMDGKLDDIAPTDDHQSSHEDELASNTAMDDDSDDFEEFVAAPVVLGGHELAVDSGTHDDWNAFDNTTDGGDDWAAFQDSDQHISSSGSRVTDSSPADILQPGVTYSSCLSKDSVSQSLHACFQPCPPSDLDQTITPLHYAFNCSHTRHITGSKMTHQDHADGLAVWHGLCVMENTPALKYQWQQSHCNDLLLRAINVDARNILNPPRKSAAPAFATNLGLLEPKKAVPDQASVDSAVMNFSSFSNSGRPKHSDAIARPAVRKAEKELLEVLELPDCGSTQTTKSRSSPLDSILKAISSTSTASSPSLGNATTTKDSPSEPLSAEASAVLARLPDLSFMHSKVLMFPVSDCAN